MSTKIVKGVILSLTAYEENDQIVQAHTDVGLISFIAKGTMKPTSKNSIALQVGNYVLLELFLARLKNRTSKLKKATIIYQLNLKNHEEINLILYLIKIWLKIKTSNIIELIKSVYVCIKLKIHTHYLYTKIKIWCLATLLNQFGYKQTVVGCSICGTVKNIACFSLYAGGLLCIDHKEDKREKSSNEIKAFIDVHSLNLKDFIRSYNNKYINYLLTFYETFYKRFLYTN